MWWEKTVEYHFIITAANAQKLDFAAPLSGVNEHTAGDGIFGSDEKLILIEFKRKADGIPTEKSLFKDYEGACKKLSGFHHHVFVYGKLKTIATNSASADNQAADLPKLELGAQPYFIGEPHKDSLDISEIAPKLRDANGHETLEFANVLDILKLGVCKTNFNEYLKALAELKEADGRSEGHVSPEQMSCVIGVTSEGNIVSTQSLHDYVPDLFPNPIKRIEHTPPKIRKKNTIR